MTEQAHELIGIDIGGTKIAAGLLEWPSGEILAARKIPTEPVQGPDAIVQNIANLVQEFSREASGRIKAMGVGICELVDRNGAIVSNNCIPWLEESIREKLGQFAPVYIEADVRAAAFAESLFGAGKDFRNFLYVTIGTGISCCLMMDGQPYLGARGATGTMASSPLTIPCEACGNVSGRTLEELAAGPALAARWQKAGGPGKTGQETLAAATRGDSSAHEIITTAALALASQIALLINVLDPEAVIIGGGLGLSEGLYWDNLVPATRRHIWSEVHRDLPILRAATGVNSAWIGAAARAQQQLSPR